MLLEGRNAVIYGGGGAIGGAVARAFATDLSSPEHHAVDDFIEQGIRWRRQSERHLRRAGLFSGDRGDAPRGALAAGSRPHGAGRVGL